MIVFFIIRKVKIFHSILSFRGRIEGFAGIHDISKKSFEICLFALLGFTLIFIVSYIFCLFQDVVSLATLALKGEIWDARFFYFTETCGEYTLLSLFLVINKEGTVIEGWRSFGWNFANNFFFGRILQYDTTFVLYNLFIFWIFFILTHRTVFY